MTEIVLTFSRPVSALNAHNNGNRYARGNAISDRRLEGFIVANNAINEFQTANWDAFSVEYRFFVPDNKRRDTVNMMQMEKATIDGIVDSGLVSGDHWQVCHVRQPVVEIDKNNPRTEIVLRKCNPTRKKTK